MKNQPKFAHNAAILYEKKDAAAVTTTIMSAISQAVPKCTVLDQMIIYTARQSGDKAIR